VLVEHRLESGVIAGGDRLVQRVIRRNRARCLYGSIRVVLEQLIDND
jgi:hypothetical protein